MKITGSAGHDINYTYYPDGLLMNRSDEQQSRQYYYQGPGLVNAVRATTKANSGESWQTFLFDSSGSRWSSYGASSDPLYYLTGGGSTAALLQGNQLQGIDYTAYGAPKQTADAAPQRTDLKSQADFLWNQEYYEANPGLVYLRSRFYNPRLMRFMTADSYPVANKYSFGNADPINMIDPSGHFSVAAVAMDAVIMAVGILSAALAPASGGGSVAVGLGITGALLGATSAGLDIGYQVTGNKKLEYASWGLMVAGAGVDGASAGLTMVTRMAERQAAAAVDDIELIKNDASYFSAQTKRTVETTHPLDNTILDRQGIWTHDSKIEGLDRLDPASSHYSVFGPKGEEPLVFMSNRPDVRNIPKKHFGGYEYRYYTTTDELQAAARAKGPNARAYGRGSDTGFNFEIPIRPYTKTTRAELLEQVQLADD